MPRRNHLNKIKPHVHEPSVYDSGYKQCCARCPFAGTEFKCLTSDGKCLINSPDRKEADDVGSK